MKRGRQPSQQELDIRYAIGNNMKILRRDAGLTLADVARHLGVSTQQVQKYERAHNSISAEKLVIFSMLVDSPLRSVFSFQPHPNNSDYSISEIKRVRLLATILQHFVSPLLQEKVCDLITSLAENAAIKPTPLSRPTQRPSSPPP